MSKYLVPNKHNGEFFDGRTRYNGKGGGGGDNYRPATEEEKRLWAAQAASLEGLNQIAMPNLATGMNNLGAMTNESMNGTLANRMRGLAQTDAITAAGQEREAMNRNLAMYGINPNSGAFADMNRQMNVQNAANRVGAMNQANVAAEDMKWNRNAALTGLASGQGAQALNGMGSLANQLSQNRNQSNAWAQQSQANQAQGVAGLAIGGKMMGLYKDGGEVRLANGGGLQMFKPTNYMSLINQENSNQSAIDSFKDVFGGINVRQTPMLYLLDKLGALQVYQPPTVSEPNQVLAKPSAESKAKDGDEIRLANGGGLQMFKPTSLKMQPWEFSGGDAPQTDEGGNLVSNIAYPAIATTMAASGLDKLGISAPKQALDGLWQAGKNLVQNPGVEATGNAVANAHQGYLTQLPDASANLGKAIESGSTEAITSATDALTGVEKAIKMTAGGGEVGSAAAAEASGAGLSSALGAAAPWLIGGLVLSELFKADGGSIKRKDMTGGGKVTGPGTETSDSIPARLSDGEYVLNAEAVKMIGKKKLDAINEAGLDKRYGPGDHKNSSGDEGMSLGGLATLGQGLYLAAPQLNAMDAQRKADERFERQDARAAEQFDLSKKDREIRLAQEQALKDFVASQKPDLYEKSAPVYGPTGSANYGDGMALSAVGSAPVQTMATGKLRPGAEAVQMLQGLAAVNPTYAGQLINAIGNMGTMERQDARYAKDDAHRDRTFGESVRVNDANIAANKDAAARGWAGVNLNRQQFDLQRPGLELAGAQAEDFKQLGDAYGTMQLHKGDTTPTGVDRYKEAEGRAEQIKARIAGRTNDKKEKAVVNLAEVDRLIGEPLMEDGKPVTDMYGKPVYTASPEARQDFIDFMNLNGIKNTDEAILRYRKSKSPPRNDTGGTNGASQFRVTGVR